MTTPTQDVIAAANVTAKVQSGAMSITIRKLLPIDRMRLASAIGPENVKNDLYLAYASLAYYVTEIDGETIPRPKSPREVEAIVQRLGDDGLTAVGEGIAKNFSTPDQTEDQVRDEIKN
jgi:hypothetical protein